MKNLFEINEDEKNRILGLHESATKNHYLINEQGDSRVVDNYNVAQTLGFGVSRTTSNKCQRVMILDGNGYYNLVSNVCPGGYIDFKIEADYENTTISGTWSVSNQNVTIKMSDGTTFSGPITKGSIKTQVTSWLIKQPKFAEYVKTQMDPTVKDTWKSWGGGSETTGKLSSEDALNKWYNYTCVLSYPGAKQFTRPDGTIEVKIGDTIYFDNGRKVGPDGTRASYSCNDLMFQDVQPKPEVQKTAGPNPLIVQLQQKLNSTDPNLKLDSNKLDQATLKAVMDKISIL